MGALALNFNRPSGSPHPPLSRPSDNFCSVSFTSENSQMKGGQCGLLRSGRSSDNCNRTRDWSMASSQGTSGIGKRMRLRALAGTAPSCSCPNPLTGKVCPVSNHPEPDREAKAEKEAEEGH